MSLDNPFAKPGEPPPNAPNEPKGDNPPTSEPKVEDKAAVEEEKDEETPLQTVTRILAQYDNKESDIPVNLNEYWSAKRRL